MSQNPQAGGNLHSLLLQLQLLLLLLCHNEGLFTFLCFHGFGTVFRLSKLWRKS